MSTRRKNFFLPPKLDTNELKPLLTKFHNPVAMADNICLLYTVLCQDLVYLHLFDVPNGYTQLHSARLEMILGAESKQVIDLLLGAGYLEVDCLSPSGEYFPGGYYSKNLKRAKAYRITQHLREDDKLFVRVALPEKCQLIRGKIERLNYARSVTVEPRERCRQHVMEKVDTLVLLVNDETRAIIEKYLLSKGKPYSAALGTALIEQFNHGPVQPPSVCAFGGRVHSQLTKLYKQLRPQLRFELYPDDALTEIDLVASQPWFLSVVSPRLINRFVPECRDAIPFFKEVAHEPDVILFRAKCANPHKNEGIYDYLRDIYNAAYGESFTRDQAKAICYRAFFSDYDRKEKTTVKKCIQTVERWEQREALAIAQAFEQGKPTSLMANSSIPVASGRRHEATVMLKKAKSRLFTQKCYEVFKAKFPGMHRLFSSIKRLQWHFERGQQEGKTTKLYANNALLAQRLESGLVYSVVIQSLLKANITNTVTIHDAFLVRKCDEAKTREVIKKAFNNVGLKPNLK